MGELQQWVDKSTNRDRNLNIPFSKMKTFKWAKINEKVDQKKKIEGVN